MIWFIHIDGSSIFYPKHRLRDLLTHLSNFMQKLRNLKMFVFPNDIRWSLEFILLRKHNICSNKVFKNKCKKYTLIYAKFDRSLCKILLLFCKKIISQILRRSLVNKDIYINTLQILWLLPHVFNINTTRKYNCWI